MVGANLDGLAVDAIRFLAIDMVQKANSGHPGAPMGAAPLTYVLWDRFLKHNPADSRWPDRDRFVLSCGHASALLYALLHLTGYPLSLEEIKRFRQWGSLAPGHPEYGLTPGVEVTTGPLGQGFANGVGMALAESRLGRIYNRPGHEIINHRTYALVSDGDLEEGISSEAASLAGTLRLGKLIYLYDSNDVTIEGRASLAFTENVRGRFEGFGWNVIGPIDGMDLAAVDGAIRQAQAQQDRPNLIICKTIIGFGSPNKAGKASAHGEPLGEEEVRLTRQNLRWPYSEPFTIPVEVLAHFRRALERGGVLQLEWNKRLSEYTRAYPAEARQLQQDLSGDLPSDWDAGLATLFQTPGQSIATREASGSVLNALAVKIPSLLGGSADLAPSTKTLIKDSVSSGFAENLERNLHFGVREHSMGAICNGLALHGGVVPYAGTFLVFYDYMRPAVRLAALMGLRVIYVFTHDSVGMGEDGPTHQPVEQLMGLRMVPNLVTLRPADASETAEAWKIALQRRSGPTALVLTRQGLPLLDRRELAGAGGAQKGAYILWQSREDPRIILIASGSEVHLALPAARELQKAGLGSRVVSMPSWELFEEQSRQYQEEVLPRNLSLRLSIEAGQTLGWERYTGNKSGCIGVTHFGASAPGNVMFEKLGLTVSDVVGRATKLLKGS
jgi:transketolase